MNIQQNLDPFPHVIIKNYFDEFELKVIWEELEFICYPQKLEPPEITGTARDNGRNLKQNRGIWLNDVYRNHLTSSILSVNRKLFNSADIIFECVPEKLKIKKNVFKLLSENTNKKTIISSTTSTILSTDLAKYNRHPERFLNAHWLNPPYLMPLIEISPCKETSKSNIKKIYNLFIKIGKVPIICKPSPGYIVPRIQSLAMNEAARILEEGAASAEDIDKSVIYGFGLRFAILGLLEFIDWGGIDTLDNASSYMTKTMKSQRFSTPSIVKKHIKNNNLGLSTQSGFMDWKNIDVEKYQEDKLKNFVKVIKLLNIQPKIKI